MKKLNKKYVWLITNIYQYLADDTIAFNTPSENKILVFSTPYVKAC